MASRKQEKADRKAEREARQEAAARAAKRTRTLQLAGGAVLAAVVLAGLLILISQSGGGASTGGDVRDTARVNKLLAGIPQKGATLGRADAPVEIREYADLQCPACKDFADNQFPAVVKDLVRPGKAKFTYRPWPILGADSIVAGRTALAAARENRLFEYAELFYANQGAENSGYVTAEYVKRLAKAAGVNEDSVARARENGDLDDELDANDRRARAMQFTGTPAFEVTGPGGTRKLPGGTDADALADAVNAVAR